MLHGLRGYSPSQRTVACKIIYILFSNKIRGIFMDGILIVNKDATCTSHDVVNKVKKILNEKVGHTGTLDPLATGVLPLLIRERD